MKGGKEHKGRKGKEEAPKLNVNDPRVVAYEELTSANNFKGKKGKGKSLNPLRSKLALSPLKNRKVGQNEQLSFIPTVSLTLFNYWLGVGFLHFAQSSVELFPRISVDLLKCCFFLLK